MKEPTKKELARWYELIPTPTQMALVKDDVRIKVVPAGRRSGKTERAKRKIVKEALKTPGKYFAAAPTNTQAKKIWWDDIKLLGFKSLQINPPNESDRIFRFNNGSEIHVIGLDVPARIEGIPWTGGVIDEIADVKEGAWEENVKPSLDTFNPLNPDHKAWCWLIGVPDGLGFYKDLYDYALESGDPEWAAYTWHSSDILPKDRIDAARRSMSERQFKQEYEASFESATNRIYEEYSVKNHTKETIQPHEQIYWSHDQNYTPLSSCICVVRDNCLFILDEIIMTSAISEQSALEFVEKYKNHKNKVLKLYGDPAGRAGEKHGHRSDYTAIKSILGKHGWTVDMQVAKKAPSIKDRQNAVRAKIRPSLGDPTLFVHTEKAEWCHKGLATVQTMKGSTYQEDQTNKYQHVTTAIGYLVHKLWPTDRISTVGSQPIQY